MVGWSIASPTIPNNKSWCFSVVTASSAFCDYELFSRADDASPFSPFGLEEERELVHVELVLCVDNLHRQAALADLVLTDAQNAVLFFALRENGQQAEIREISSSNEVNAV